MSDDVLDDRLIAALREIGAAAADALKAKAARIAALEAELRDKDDAWHDEIARREQAEAALAEARRHNCDHWRGDFMGCVDCKALVNAWCEQARTEGERIGRAQGLQRVRDFVDALPSEEIRENAE